MQPCQHFLSLYILLYKCNPVPIFVIFPHKMQSWPLFSFFPFYRFNTLSPYFPFPCPHFQFFSLYKCNPANIFYYYTSLCATITLSPLSLFPTFTNATLPIFSIISPFIKKNPALFRLMHPSHIPPYRKFMI